MCGFLSLSLSLFLSLLCASDYKDAAKSISLKDDVTELQAEQVALSKQQAEMDKFLDLGLVESRRHLSSSEHMTGVLHLCTAPTRLSCSSQQRL